LDGNLRDRHGYDKALGGSPTGRKIDHSFLNQKHVCLFLKILHEYDTQMLELSVLPKSTIKSLLAKAFTTMPYLLFYLAMGLRFGLTDNENVLTTARSTYISAFHSPKSFIAESFWHSIWKSGIFNLSNSLSL
jgi:hypothetical protein